MQLNTATSNAGTMYVGPERSTEARCSFPIRRQTGYTCMDINRSPNEDSVCDIISSGIGRVTISTCDAGYRAQSIDHECGFCMLLLPYIPA